MPWACHNLQYPDGWPSNLHISIKLCNQTWQMKTHPKHRTLRMFNSHDWLPKGISPKNSSSPLSPMNPWFLFSKSHLYPTHRRVLSHLWGCHKSGAIGWHADYALCNSRACQVRGQTHWGDWGVDDLSCLMVLTCWKKTNFRTEMVVKTGVVTGSVPQENQI